MNTQKTSILIVDDHEVVLEGSKKLLDSEVDFIVEMEKNSGNVMSRLNDSTYDVFLLDVNMNPINGIALSESIKKQLPNSIIILYTGYNLTDYYKLLLENKIDGILSKTATREQVIQTIRAALRKEILVSADFLHYVNSQHQREKVKAIFSISDKERKVLEYVAKGYTNKAMAFELQVTQRTIENYLSKVFSKFGVDSRAEAVMKAKELNII
ncbi:response regulator transcription factor [Lysinibacillus sp. 54212]|uniref:response regulator transcription factor n=1 Tax=Lysinibacillus sp. 54212 TaxID=3119829 RepID=UPI002FC99068